MTRRRRLLLPTLGTALLLVAALTACAPDTPAPSGSGTSTGGAASASPSATASAEPDGTPSPTATASGDIALPTDCRAILSDAVLAQLEGVPLNDPAWGSTGVQPDGSLKCIWADPGADTTGLTTVISRMSRGPALDLLNKLTLEQAFTCYQPDTGTRCERQWPNSTYPVTDGRTLYWRDGILIDSTYSNLSPSGYTASIVDHVFV